MALNLPAKYPGRFNAPSADYPQGSFKNQTAPNSEDGSYMEQDWLNDWNGFFGAAMAEAGETPSGVVDTARNSQLYKAMKKSIASFTQSGTGAVTRTAQDKMRESVSVKDFGAKGDGVADDTKAIQDAINYAAPYVWKGTPQATTSDNNPVAALHLPAGNYRITTPLLLAKGLHIYGDTMVGFFNSGGSRIIADFDTSGFILDAAPYNTFGVREVGKVFSGNAFDNGEISSVNSVLLENFSVVAADGRKVLGGINLTASSQSVITNCAALNVDCGIRVSASWAGSIRDCHIVANMLGIVCLLDVTTIDVTNNYVTVKGNSTSGYTWLQMIGLNSSSVDTTSPYYDKSICIFLKYANPILTKNTLEGGGWGIVSESGFALNAYANYMEKITVSCYGMNTTNANIVGGYTFCPSAKLLWATGSATTSIKMDFTGVGMLNVIPAAFDVNYINNVQFAVGESTGSNFDYHARVTTITQRHATGVHRTWVSSSGSDTNSGLTQSKAVLTFQEAIRRLRAGCLNEIVIPGSETVNTKYMVDGVATTYYTPIPVTLHVYSTGTGVTSGTIAVGVSGDETHGINFQGGDVHFTNLKITLPTTTSPNYRAFIRARAPLDVSFNSCDIVGKGAKSGLVGGLYNMASTVNITSIGSTFTSLQLVTEAIEFGGSGTVMWTENNAGSTFTTVTADTSLKIKSKQFP